MRFTAPLMKKSLLFLCFAALTISLLPGKLLALHVAAVNITYEGVDTFQYIITVRLYRDCRLFLNNVQPNITINYESFSCGTSGSAALPLITGDSTGNPGTGNFIELPCLGVTTCMGATEYAVEEFVYQDTIILPLVCSDWIISYETQGQRNTNDVLVNPTSQTIFVSALLNNLYAPGNNSPTFDKPPIAIFCVRDNEFFFDQGAVEPDGDSLVYSLAPAQGDTGSFLDYVSPYAFQTPFNVITPMKMDSVNGIISFTPDTPAVTSVMCVLIEEYRNNILIGSIKNDMQVIISDSCLADTLNFSGDTTTATGNHPAISVLCLDSLITVFFDNPIQCETVAGDGSDFILDGLPVGQSVYIYAATIPNCNAGLTDTVILHLTDSLQFNGSFYILSVTGTDGNPLLSECGLPLEDTLEVRLRDCVKASVELKNVSVVDNDSIQIVWQTSTENFSLSFFSRYDIYRSNSPSGPYNLIDSTLAISDTIIYDINVNVSSNAYNYAVKLILNTALVPPLSDSIQSILLRGEINLSDTTQLNLSWTPYWGWSDPKYSIMQKIADGEWVELDSTDNTDYSYTIPLLANTYWLKIETRDNISNLISESNWIEREVLIRKIPNVITPNGDGINDFFFINELLFYEPIHLKVYNRWGRKVFEDENYKNDWNGVNMWGKSLAEGTYFYVLLFSDGASRNGNIMILR